MGNVLGQMHSSDPAIWAILTTLTGIYRTTRYVVDDDIADLHHYITT